MNYIKKIKFTLIAIIVLAIVCAGGFFYAKYKYEHMNTGETVDHGLITETTVSLTGETRRDGLTDIRELATEEYFFTRVETYDSSKNIKGFKVPFTTSRFVYSYDGTVKAGIDFTGIEVEKDDLKKTITVILPASHILDCSIDPESFEVYDEKRSVFNPVSITDYNDSLEEMIEAAKEDALEKGILERADSNAELLIKNLIMSTYDVDDYYIDITKAQ